jgi:ABC-2 type transport system permease protein
VTSAALETLHAASVKPSPVADFLRDTAAVADVEFKKLIRDPTEVLARAVQPILWLVIFGGVFTRIRAIPTGNVSYLAFLAPGILAQSVLFAAIFYGVAVVWERDLGIVHKLLVSPAPRTALVFGKAVSSGFRGVVQAVVIYLTAAAMGISVRRSPLSILAVLLAVMLGSAVFSTFSLIIACLVKSRERFMGIGQLMTMPLFFASNAIYPMAIMPPWLKFVALVNPLTYLVDALRGQMIGGGQATHSMALNFGVLILIFSLFVSIAAKLYPSLAH